MCFCSAARPPDPARPPAPYGPRRRSANCAGTRWSSTASCTSRSTRSPTRNGATATRIRHVFNPTDFDADQIVADGEGGRHAGTDPDRQTPRRLLPLAVSSSPSTRVKNCAVARREGRRRPGICDACRRHGLRFGVYLSPWDRNHKDYGRPEYVTYYRNQLRELLTDYGDIFTVWFDGANGGDGYYGGARETRRIDNRTYYDWKNTWNDRPGTDADGRHVQRRRAGLPLGRQRDAASPARPAGPRSTCGDGMPGGTPGEPESGRASRHRLGAGRVRRLDPARAGSITRRKTTQVKTPAAAARHLLPVRRTRRLPEPESASRPARPDPRERRQVAARVPPDPGRHCSRTNLARQAKLVRRATCAATTRRSPPSNLAGRRSQHLLGHRRPGHHARTGRGSRQAGDGQRRELCASTCPLGSAHRGLCRWTWQEASGSKFAQRHEHRQPAACCALNPPRHSKALATKVPVCRTRQFAGTALN